VRGHKQILARVAAMVAAAILLPLAACSGGDDGATTPGLVDRGTQMTTTKPTRQDITNKVSLTGKVEINPVYGLVAPIDGEVHFFDITPSQATPTRPTAAANVWINNKPTRVEIPAGSTFAGRLVPDKSNVVAGMPIVSARYAGYGITADIDPGQAYQIADGLATVRVQIQNGPGPFACDLMGTIAALPAGTIPDPPAAQPDPNATAPPPVSNDPPITSNPSAATGIRLVCAAPTDVLLINGAGATLEVVTASATNALVLPVEAVAGSQGKGQVDVMQPDGTKKTVDVELGLTDGQVIEIKSGLTGDETVAVPGPNLPPGEATGDGQTAPGGGPVVVRK
jgi:hypothetical protein